MRIAKEFKFESAHTVLGAFTRKCDRTRGGGIHGHSYVMQLILDSRDLDPAGMVMDFTRVKKLFGSFVDMFDHSLLIYLEDPGLLNLGRALSDRYVVLPYNPTAELMAVHFLKIAADIPELEKYVHSCRVYETVTSWAEATREDVVHLSHLVSGEVMISPSIANSDTEIIRANVCVDDDYDGENIVRAVMGLVENKQ